MPQRSLACVGRFVARLGLGLWRCFVGCIWSVVVGLTGLTLNEAEPVTRAIRRRPGKSCGLLMGSALASNWLGFRAGVARSRAQARRQGVQGELAAGVVGSFAGALRGLVNGGLEGYVRGCRITWRRYLKRHLRASERVAPPTPVHVGAIAIGFDGQAIDLRVDGGAIGVEACGGAATGPSAFATIVDVLQWDRVSPSMRSMQEGAQMLALHAPAEGVPGDPRDRARAWRGSRRPVARAVQLEEPRPSRRQVGASEPMRPGATVERPVRIAGARRHRREPFELLCRLFRSLFATYDEFYVWVRLGPDGAEMVAMMPGVGGSLQVSITRGLDVLDRVGYLDAAFFRRLLADFGRREADIVWVLAQWRWRRRLH